LRNIHLNSVATATSASTLAKIEDIMAQPWTPLGNVAATASSGDVPGIDAVKAAVQTTLWILTKPFQEKANKIVLDNIYAGFEDGDFYAYVRNSGNNQRPLVYNRAANASCLPYNGIQCIEVFNNSTDPVHGTIIGQPSQYIPNFDPRTRPVRCRLIACFQ
jgi:hypothetical protein